MSNYEFNNAVREWSIIPVDDVGYFPCTTLLRLRDTQIIQLANLAYDYRYNEEGWRNTGGSLRKFMDIENVAGKIVLDFGCGFGIDALEYCRNGARVILADISPYNLVVAQRTMWVQGQAARKLMIILDSYPYFERLNQPVDIFWSMGVLHHTPNIAAILQSAFSVLRAKECRIVLYSDKRWEKMMKEPCPPIDQPIDTHPRFKDWVRANDETGEYTDWYSPEKINLLAEKIGAIGEVSYIGDEQLIGALFRMPDECNQILDK